MYKGFSWPKKAVLFSLLTVLGTSLTSGLLLSARHASADTSSVVVTNKALMTFDGKQYKDTNPFDDSYEWRTDGNCQSIIKIENFSASKPTADVEVKGSTSTKSCDTLQTYSKVALTSPEKRNTTAYRIDGDNILTIVGFKEKNACTSGAGDNVDGSKTNTFQKAKVGEPDRKNNVYYQVQGGTPPLKKDLDLTTSSSAAGQVKVRNTCGLGDRTETFDVSIAPTSQLSDSEKATYGINSAGQLTSTTGNAGDDGTHVDCSWSINPLTWIMCPLVDLSQAIINGAGSWIQSQLEIDANSYFKTDNDTGRAIYAAWNSVRVISMSLLVIIGLAMVVAQALSFDFVDAYTVKKVLPRLLIAVIAIALSWQLAALAVQLSNDLALAVRTIIITPFKETLGDASINGGELSIAALGVGGGIALAAGTMSILGVLLFLGTAALAVLMAMIAIILRQMLVILLVILAPIAILAYILPGTQKGWKLWHEGFTGALLVYPIITAFIAIGAVFGQITSAVGGHNGVSDPLTGIIALVATYIPYFLIPKAFQMAGGLVATLSGAVNDRGRGAFDRLKKARQNERQKTWHRVQAGKRFRGGGLKKDGSGGLNRRGKLNAIGEAASQVSKIGANPTRWKGKLSDAISVANQEHANKALQEDQVKLARAKDDAITGALIHSHGSEKAAEDFLVGDSGTASLYGGGKIDGKLIDRWNKASAGEAHDDEGYALGADGNRIENAQWRYNYDKNAGNRDAAMRVIREMNRDYGVETAELIALRMRMRSSTAYSDVNGFGEMAKEINMVAKGDTLLKTQLLEEGNAAQNAAGRTDVGGGSFSVGITAINNIGRQVSVRPSTGQAGIYDEEDATYDVLKSVSEGKSAQQTLASGKDKVGKAISNFVYREAENKRVAAKTKMDREIAEAGGDEIKITKAKADFKKETIRATVWEQSYHIAAASSSADHAKAFGEQSSQQFDLNSLPDDVKERITTRTEVVTEPDPSNPGQERPVRVPDPLHPGEFKPKTRVIKDTSLTHSQVWDRLRGDPDWNLYAKEYGVAQAAANAAGAAAGAAGAAIEGAAADAANAANPPPTG